MAAAISALISLGLMVWFVVFTVLVIQKLDKVIALLEKKQIS
jgi:hypothetical protein